MVSTLEIFGTLSNVVELEYAINCEISKISSWLVSNMLVLNVAKSKLMLFFKSPKRSPKLTMTINGDIIEQVEEFNSLDITVDQNVTWDAHITKLSIKLARVICILHKLKRTFPQHILRTIYNSLIHPHFIYGLCLWGLRCRCIKVLQKKAVRILAFIPYISHSTPIFKTLQILKIEDLYTVQLYKLYYKLRNNLLSSYFHTFTPYYHNDHHTHDLRYRILRLPMTRREYIAECTCTKYQFLKLIRCERASLYLYPANLSVHITKCTDRKVTILMYCIMSHFVLTHFVEVE